MENKTKYNHNPVYGYHFNIHNWAHLRVAEGRYSYRISLIHLAPKESPKVKP
jgi:hypothetical protein